MNQKEKIMDKFSNFHKIDPENKGDMLSENYKKKMQLYLIFAFKPFNSFL